MNITQTSLTELPSKFSDFRGQGLGRILHRVFAMRSVWVCSCGYVIPKNGAILSGDDWCSQGFHVHCPRCGRVVVQFVDPKRVGH
jgi:hypothetical protein